MMTTRSGSCRRSAHSLREAARCAGCIIRGKFTAARRGGFNGTGGGGGGGGESNKADQQSRSQALANVCRRLESALEGRGLSDASALRGGGSGAAAAAPSPPAPGGGRSRCSVSQSGSVQSGGRAGGRQVQEAEDGLLYGYSTSRRRIGVNQKRDGIADNLLSSQNGSCHQGGQRLYNLRHLGDHNNYHRGSNITGGSLHGPFLREELTKGRIPCPRWLTRVHSNHLFGGGGLAAPATMAGIDLAGSELPVLLWRHSSRYRWVSSLCELDRDRIGEANSRRVSSPTTGGIRISSSSSDSSDYNASGQTSGVGFVNNRRANGIFPLCAGGILSSKTSSRFKPRSSASLLSQSEPRGAAYSTSVHVQNLEDSAMVSSRATDDGDHHRRQGESRLLTGVEVNEKLEQVMMNRSSSSCASASTSTSTPDPIDTPPCVVSPNVNALFTLARARQFDQMLILHDQLVAEEKGKGGGTKGGGGGGIVSPLFQPMTYKNLADVCGSYQGSAYMVPLFRKMSEAGVVPDVSTYGAAIKACVRSIVVYPLTLVSARIRKGDEKVRVINHRELADACSKRAVADALHLLSHMRTSGPRRNFIVYLPLLGPLSTLGMTTELTNVIHWMIEDEVEMEVETVSKLAGRSRVGAIAMTALVWGWIRAGRLDKALESLQNATCHGWELDKVVYKLLLTHCVEAKVFDGLEDVLPPVLWDEHCMSTFFGALGKQGMIEVAVHYLLVLKKHLDARPVRRSGGRAGDGDGSRTKKKNDLSSSLSASFRHSHGRPPATTDQVIAADVNSTLLRPPRQDGGDDVVDGASSSFTARSATESKLTFAMNLFLTSFGKNHTVEELKEVIRRLKEGVGVEPSHVTYNIMISSACRHGNMMKALDLVEEAKQAGFPLGTRTFNSILGGFARSRLIDEAFELLGAMERLGVVPNVVTYSTLIHACATSDQVESAYTVLAEMVKKGVKRNVYSYNPLIAAFGSRGQLKRALDVLHELKSDGVEPNDITYALMIRACGIVKNVEKAFELYQEMLDAGIKPSSNVDATLLTACSRAGETRRALEVFEQMERRGETPDRVVSSALLLGLAAQGMPHEALALYKKMRANGAWPKPGSVSRLMAELGKTGELDAVFEIFEDMKNPNASLDISPYDRDVYYYGRCTALLTACTRNSQLEKALGFLKQLQKEGWQNESVLFDQLLLNCSLASDDSGGVRWLDVDDGFAVIEVMKKLGVRPSRIGLEALIDCCHAMGNAEKAEEVVQLMEKEGLPLTIFTLVRLFNAYVSAGDSQRAIQTLSQMGGNDLQDNDVQLLLRKIMQPYFEAAAESPERAAAADTLPELRASVQGVFARLRSSSSSSSARKSADSSSSYEQQLGEGQEEGEEEEEEEAGEGRRTDADVEEGSAAAADAGEYGLDGLPPPLPPEEESPAVGQHYP